MKHIFLAPERHAEWQAMLAADDITALAVLRLLEAASASTTAGSDGIEDLHGTSCLAWLRQDRNLAAAARDAMLAKVTEEPASDLVKAEYALAAALTWEFGVELWEETDRRRFASALAELARSFLTVCPGNPHTVTNNWWMITHAACLLACIAVDGEEGDEGTIDVAGIRGWAYERVKAFCALFGSAGLYHEGNGYTAYTLSMLLPALIATERHLDPGIFDMFPQLRRSVASMLVGTAAFEHLDNGAGEPRFGASLQWNDMGRGCLGLNPFVPGMVVAPTTWIGGLRTLFDRLVPLDRNTPRHMDYQGLPLLVALYPFSIPAEDPHAHIPRTVWDQRQGLGMWRNEWGTGGETVFGWYARSTHAGGHKHDDAASIRLMAQGRTWICGGGQARKDAVWQTVLTHADPSQRPIPSPLAHVTCCQMHASGGVVGIDTRNCLRAYGERYLSWRADVDHTFALAMLDLVDEHEQPPRSWLWNLSFPRDLAADLHPDGAGFSLVDPVRGCLTARFLIDQPDQLEACTMPASSRTYSDGVRRDYPGDHFIQARFDGRPTLRILVGMVIHRDGQCTRHADIELEDNRIMLDGSAWDSPFYPAILNSVDLASSTPNRMKTPAG